MSARIYALERNISLQVPLLYRQAAYSPDSPNKYWFPAHDYNPFYFLTCHQAFLSYFIKNLIYLYNFLSHRF